MAAIHSGTNPEVVNRLFFGDNLELLRDRDRFPSNSVDMVYSDGPFNTKRQFSVWNGSEDEAQLRAFTDMFDWCEQERTFKALTRGQNSRISACMMALRDVLGRGPTLAYLSFMAARLLEAYRCLKPGGAFFLHCDPNASHYLKIVLDSIFDCGSDLRIGRGFINEISWKRHAGAHSDGLQGAKHYGRIHDNILFYRKPGKILAWTTMYHPGTETTDVTDKFPTRDEKTGEYFLWEKVDGPGGAAKGNPRITFNGRSCYARINQADVDRLAARGEFRWLENNKWPQRKVWASERMHRLSGTQLQDLWDDIVMPPNERTGWPTQKALELLKRLIEGNTIAGMVILDPFAGCGTTVVAAMETGRYWIGIEIAYWATELTRRRLAESTPWTASLFDQQGTYNPSYTIHGVPMDVSGARALALSKPNGRWEFQIWSCARFGANSSREGLDAYKRGADGRIDALMKVDRKRGHDTVIVSSKSGKPHPNDIAQLVASITLHDAQMGVLIELNEPTPTMRADAKRLGNYDGVPKLQIITVKELLDGKGLRYPKGHVS